MPEPRRHVELDVFNRNHLLSGRWGAILIAFGTGILLIAFALIVRD
jgi:hypothetical protein